MRKIFFIFILLFGLFAVIAVTGFYPVALVNGHPLWNRDWVSLQQATLHALALQEHASGRSLDILDAKNINLILAVKRDTLGSLIDDAIVSQNGGVLVANLAETAMQRFNAAVKNRDNLQHAAETVYGFTIDKLQNLILLPQSRREIIQAELEKQQKNFQQWLENGKKEARVKLFFVPFRWDGTQLK